MIAVWAVSLGLAVLAMHFGHDAFAPRATPSHVGRHRPTGHGLSGESHLSLTRRSHR